MSRTGRLAATAMTALALTGCSLPSLQSIRLPGGGVSGSTMTVKAEFDNVLDLVPQASVKSGDVTIGTVDSVALTPRRTALVTMSVAKSVPLPANSKALLVETSLLGEKFVELDAPTDAAPQGHLAAGQTLPAQGNTTYPDVETVFGALSSVLNGGGLEKIETINLELVKALSGREQQVRDLLGQLGTFVGGLDTQKAQIVRAIDAFDQLATTLRAGNDTIAKALDEIGPGLTVLADERSTLTSVLTGLSDLGTVSQRIVAQSASATKQDLQLLQPVLTKLNEAGKHLPSSLEILQTFPLPRHAQDAVMGDLQRLYVYADQGGTCALLNLPATSCGLPLPALAPAAAPASAQPKAASAAPAAPSAPGPAAILPTVPTLPAAPAAPSLPGPAAPQAPSSSTPSSGNSGLINLLKGSML